MIAKEIGAIFMVDMAHFAGLAATGVYPSPVPHADVVTTTTHKTLRGPRGGMILCKAEHTAVVNKAMFPGTQGGPLEHVIAAKAVAFKEALEPAFTTYCKQIVANAQALARRSLYRDYPARLRRHRQPPDARRPAQQGSYGERWPRRRWMSPGLR